MGIESKEEIAVHAAKGVWHQLPEVQQRQKQIAGILVHEGVNFDADGLTRALQIAIALDNAKPMLSVVPWMQTTRQWPFDTEDGEIRKKEAAA